MVFNGRTRIVRINTCINILNKKQLTHVLNDKKNKNTVNVNNKNKLN